MKQMFKEADDYHLFSLILRNLALGRLQTIPNRHSLIVVSANKRKNVTSASFGMNEKGSTTTE